MSAGRIIDDHLELANIGTKTHAQIEAHIQGIGNYAFPATDGAANQILETDGADVLSWCDKPGGFACASLNACNLTDIGTRAHSSLTGIGVSDHHTDHQAASAEDATFKSVNIATGEAYKQNNVAILKEKATANTCIAEGAGRSVSGNYNVFIGYRSGYSSSMSGSNNAFIGYQAGYVNTIGANNAFIGYQAGYANLGGTANVFIGRKAGDSNTGGNNNVFVGHEAGQANTSGNNNTLIGLEAGNSITNKSYNVCIGHKAGHTFNDHFKLYIAAHSTDAYTLIHGDFKYKRMYHKGGDSAPADADFHNSDINFWIDEVNDQLEIKVKKSNGTVITGNVQLA